MRHSLGRKIKSHFCRKEKQYKNNNNTRLVNRFTLSIIDLDLSYQDLSYYKGFTFSIDSCRLDKK